MTEQSAPGAGRFREVFAVSEFRALWLAQVASVVGDQLAAVGIAVLVFNRTGSPAWTALSYAMTFLPDLVGGTLLAGLADRFPRRRVMITCDVARAGLVAVMAIPGQPVAFLVPALGAIQLLSAPFLAARSAVLPAALTGERFVTGVLVTRMTVQLGQVAGFAVGAAVVAAMGTSAALLADAGTFLLSAVLVRAGSRLHRPQPAARDQQRSGPDIALDLASSRADSKGVTIQVYRPAGRRQQGCGRSPTAERVWVVAALTRRSGDRERDRTLRDRMPRDASCLVAAWAPRVGAPE